MDEQTQSHRKQAALDKISALYGTDEGEYGPTLFVSHHLAEIGPDYWLDACGSETPDPALVLRSLILVGSWSANEDDAIDVFDFSLPGNVTDYVLSVRFDEKGEVSEVTMES